MRDFPTRRRSTLIGVIDKEGDKGLNKRKGKLGKRLTTPPVYSMNCTWVSLKGGYGRTKSQIRENQLDLD